ncbi:DUF1289 domain-containing protein [Vibrio brasiliensis]|uniref:DUF1289 domain-containing protein n=1 Tax=Vibrio brasiliensis TaxID=170652 RepID=UPI001EFD762F|nr:DUF1289 domain-containing protein [Vibrio brasiliensis]MCG9784065.1 DUF1289 domain-containing protein [Vibrio brasiliensis]
MSRPKSNNNDTSTVAQPCIRHCCLDENDVCLGCYRTLEEILNWSASSNEEKRAILDLCQTRKQSRNR